MYIHEAAELAGTTKKAIEYYCQKGLLSPQFTENGYRDFTEEDVICLIKITAINWTVELTNSGLISDLSYFASLRRRFFFLVSEIADVLLAGGGLCRAAFFGW